METLTFKLDEDLAKKMELIMLKHRYSTRTEFIREAIRDKIKDLEIDQIIMKMYGASKRKTTDKQLHRVREKIAKELEEEFK